jgi:hypothetical protein
MQGIGFTTHNVPLVLSGAKDVTRRMIKGVPEPVTRIEHSHRKVWSMLDADGILVGTIRCRYYPGETVYMREQWLLADGHILYRADHPDDPKRHWATSRFMPANASRQLLTVLSIRAERLQAIEDADVSREGIAVDQGPIRDHFARLWNEINAGRQGGASWTSDPWVYRIELQRTTNTEKKQHG